MADLPKMIEKKTDEAATNPLATALTIATYPLAALAAYWVGRTEVRKAIYKNFVSAGAFKDLQPTHRAELVDIIKQSETAAVDGPGLTKLQNNAYRLAVKEKFEKAGFNGVLDYWHGIHPNQKANAVLFAAGAAGIVITTSLAFINNKALLEKLTNKEKEAEHSLPQQ